MRFPAADLETLRCIAVFALSLGFSGSLTAAWVLALVL